MNVSKLVAAKFTPATGTLTRGLCRGVWLTAGFLFVVSAARLLQP